MTTISSRPLKKSYKTVNGKQMAYHESGQGQTILFLHGNPTSSYLWRNVIPHLSNLGRCIAPDLIGCGDSDKLDNPGPDSYRIVEHREYLTGLLEQLELGNDIILVLHDWGSALGFDIANRHRDRIAGVVYMEAVVRPLTWDEWPESARSFFQGLRSDAGEKMIIEKNLFIEAVLPGSILRQLSKEEHDEYREPFLEPQHRRPTLTFPREIPIDGEPPDVHAIVSDYADYLVKSDVPKLFINADPGSILIGAQRDFCRAWPNQTEVTVAGLHFIQEDSPDEIGMAISDWLSTL